MTAGDAILTHLSMLLPVYGEGIIDFILWSLGRDDKPWTTYVARPALFTLGFWGAWYWGTGTWYWTIAVMITAFWAFFPLLINLILGKPMGYLGQNPWDRLMAKIQPAWMRIWIFIWLYITAVCFYYYA